MSDELADNYEHDLEATIGLPGRLLTLSKDGYLRSHPGHAVVFNANLCTQAGQIFHGDLDLTLQEPALIELAKRIGESGVFA